MFECGGPELRVIQANMRGDVRITRMRDLLPDGFRLEKKASRRRKA